MISSKFISKAAAFIMLVAVAACIAAVVFANRIKESTGEECHPVGGQGNEA